MIARESKFSILFRHWIKKYPQITAAFEMKDTRGLSSLPFVEVSQAQLDYGMAIKSDKGVLLRVQAVAEGMPDYVYLRNEPANIVIKYPHCFVMIDVETFMLERGRSERKSLTEGRAKDLAIKVIEL